MPDPTLQELYNQLRETEQRSPAHEELIRAIEALDQAALPFRRFQNRRKLPLVKARDKTRLMELHQQIGAKAEALLAGAESKELKELVKKLAARSSQNYNALLQYDPVKNPRTLESLEEQSRTLVLHVGANDFGNAEKLGANLSERMPLALYDDSGKKISGVFTKKTTLEVRRSFENAIDAALASETGKNNPLARKAFQALRDAIGTPRVLRSPTGEAIRLSDDAASNVYELLKRCTVKRNNKSKLDNLDVYSVVRQFLPPEEAVQLRPEQCIPLTEQLEPIRGSISMNFNAAKIPEGSRLDNRNAAMSAVADLMGMPRVVARSRSMKIVDANGNEIEGTFMELAKGLDVKNLHPMAQLIDGEALEYSSGNGFKAVANLQVLDYICGNVDRHAANMTYGFDPNTKFYGVHGFDNDCSFGTLVPASGEGKNRMCGVKKMRAIPADTYRRVMQLTPATLKYALRGYGLSEEELTAAGKRLETLQRDLRAEKEFFEDYDRDRRQRGNLLPGHTRVLQDDEWRRYHPTQYATELSGESTGNAFSFAVSQITNMSRTWQKQEKEFKDLTRTIGAGIRNRAYRSTAARERNKAADLQSVLGKRTWWGFSSENYRNVQTAVKNYLEAQKQLAERLKAANSEEAKRSSAYRSAMDAVVTQADLERLRQLSQRMKEAAQTYLNGKLVNGQIPANAGDYTKSRIEIAQQVLEYGRQGSEIRPEETRKAQANEAEAQKHTAGRNALLAADAPKTPEVSKLPQH